MPTFIRISGFQRRKNQEPCPREWGASLISSNTVKNLIWSFGLMPMGDHYNKLLYGGLDLHRQRNFYPFQMTMLSRSNDPYFITPHRPSLS